MYSEGSDNSSALASVRLAKLSLNPTVNDLDNALAQAERNKSAVVELPWKSGVSPTFVLKVSFADGEDGPRWSLFRGDSVDANVLWSFDSEDTSLIESLVLAECGTERTLAESVVSSSSVPKSVNPVASGVSASEIAANIASDDNLPPPAVVDETALAAFEQSLREPDTGLLKGDALLYCIKREYERFRATGEGFAIMVLELNVNYGKPVDEPMPERAFKEALGRIGKILRGCDDIGRFADGRFICLFPGATSNEAIEPGKRFEKVLSDKPLQPGLDPAQVRFFAGLASIPDTCLNPGVLIAAAQEALAQAKERRTAVAVFPSATR